MVADLLRAGADDLGGISPVTPDHVNPERPWPNVAALEQVVGSVGLQLRPRLTLHPSTSLVRRGPIRGSALTSRPCRPGLGTGGAPDPAAGRPWQEADPGYDEFAAHESGGRTDLADTIDLTGRRADARSDMASVFGDWDGIADRARRVSAPERLSADVREALALAEQDPASLADSGHHDAAVALMSCDGAALEALTRLADDVRARLWVRTSPGVVNRNLNFTNVCYTGCRFCAFAQRADDPDAFTLSLAQVGSGWTRRSPPVPPRSVCRAGSIPELPGTAYFDLAREVKRRGPGLHLHAFQSMEVVNGAQRSGGCRSGTGW